MKLLTELDSLDNVKDGETRKLVTKATSSGSGNVVSSVSVSGDTVTYTKGVTALTAHQNAFSNVKVGSTTVAADSAGDTLELVAGSNVTLTPDATNDKVTIAATDTTYESKAAASGGTAVSLVTTGEKYTWNNKQNALSTQTAYSAKGTATKVPQITTNTLGQVTKIEEVTITQPTVNNATLTIQKNGTTVKTFTANASTDVTANITVPTKVSELTNDSGYTTNTGTITGITMNGASKGTSGVVDLGTVITDVSNKYDKSGGAITGAITRTLASSGTIASTNLFTVTGSTDGFKVDYAATTADVGVTTMSTTDDANAKISIGNTVSSTYKEAVSISNGSATVNGYTVAAAAAKSVDTSIAAASTSANLPTSAAVASFVEGKGYTTNTGTITKVQANGTDVASSGTANIPAATTSKYGVTELSSATNSTSEALAATPKAVKAAYDLAASKGTGTITGVSVNGTSVATSGVANITSMPASILSGAIPSAVTATTQSAGDNSTKIATTAFVKTAIDNLPDPMVFKGSLGTGGTITALPVDGSASIGDTYKVITAGTYASQTAKVGDTFICLTKTSSANTWELIPSGDEPSGTVTSITLKATSPIAIDSSSAITTSGTRTLSHANSGVTAGTYRSVTVNATGHVTAGTNPTTLSGYGITDAKIASGVITLGSNTITPLTASSTLDATKVSGTLPTSTYTDTKNTAGSTDSSSKLFLIGATSQAANPQTYSQDTAYVDTNGHLYSNSKQVVNLSDTQALTNKTYNGYTLAAACAKAVVTSVDTSASLPTSGAVKTFVEGKGYVTTDTKNTAGSTDTSSKIFLIGATSQAANSQTYSDNEVYATSGVLTTKSVQVGGTAATMQYNSTDKCIEFIFA